MAETQFDPDRHLDAVLPTLGLTLPPEWRPAVVAHLAAIQKAADSVMAVKLGDDVEPAPVFEP
jgi:hypothetical protein